MLHSRLSVSSGLRLFLVFLLLFPASPGVVAAGTGFVETSQPLRSGGWKVVVGEESAWSQTANQDEIGSQGGAVDGREGRVSVTIPPGALRQSVPIIIKKSAVEFSRDRESSIKADDILVAAASELGPSGTTFSRPVEVVMAISPTVQEQLKLGHKLVIAVANGDILKQIKEFQVDDEGRVHFHLEHFSTAFVLAIAGVAIVSLGMLAGRLIATDSPHIMIQPFHKDVRDFIDEGNLSLPQNIKLTGTTDLGVNKTFKGTLGFLKTINGGAAIVKMKDGSKVNCQDLTFLAASLLLGSGDPRFKQLICVGGNASVGRYSGDHMWVEVKIGGKIYVVDTANPGQLILMPKSEAYEKYNLQPTFEFGYKKRRKSYSGLSGVSGIDEPTRAQLDKAYHDGDEMGCLHQSLLPAAIKAELRRVYGAMAHDKIKKRFREGYVKGGQRCRP